MFKTVQDLPEILREIPGVRPWGSGWRVPDNAATLAFGSSARPPYGPEEARKLLPKFPFLSQEARERMTDHQVRLIAGALGTVGHHEWAPAGAGKTLAALAIAARSASQGPIVVVTPSAVLPGWETQTLRWTLMDPRILSGQTPHKLKAEKGAVYLIGWENLKHWRTALKTLKPRMLIYDESHYLRRPRRVRAVQQRDGSVRYDDLNNTLAAATDLSRSIKKRLSLTASPIPGRIADLWVQLDLIEPWQWGSFFEFAQRYAGPMHNGYGWAYDGVSSAQELKTRLETVRTWISLAETHAHLPPKRREVVMLPFGQQDKPVGMKREIQQAQSDPSTFFEALLAEAASRKETQTCRRVTDALLSGQKVVVFTARRRHVERLRDKLTKHLQKKCPRADLFWGHGEVSPEERDKTRQEYMNHPGPCVLVGTGAAWGVGIDLQDTDLALFVMLPWTPDALIQWEGRFHRLGQKRPVLVTYLICEGTADEQVADTLLGKLDDIVEVQEEATLTDINHALAGIDESDEGKIALLTRISQRQL